MCETEISGQAFTYCPLGTALVSAVPRRPKLAHNLECLLAWRPFWGTGRKILEIGDRLQRMPEASMGETEIVFDVVELGVDLKGSLPRHDGSSGISQAGKRQTERAPRECRIGIYRDCILEEGSGLWQTVLVQCDDAQDERDRWVIRGDATGLLCPFPGLVPHLTFYRQLAELHQEIWWNSSLEAVEDLFSIAKISDYGVSSGESLAQWISCHSLTQRACEQFDHLKALA